eukprot:5749918-Amphidinium_carterae.1
MPPSSDQPHRGKNRRPLRAPIPVIGAATCPFHCRPSTVLHSIHVLYCAQLSGARHHDDKYDQQRGSCC